MGRWWERWGACPRIPHFFPVYIRKVGKTPETRNSTGLSRVLKKQVGSKWGTEKVGSKWGEATEVLMAVQKKFERHGRFPGPQSLPFREGRRAKIKHATSISVLLQATPVVFQ